MANLDYEAKRTIKGHRFVFMRNEENLNAKGQRILGFPTMQVSFLMGSFGAHPSPLKGEEGLGLRPEHFSDPSARAARPQGRNRTICPGQVTNRSREGKISALASLTKTEGRGRQHQEGPRGRPQEEREGLPRRHRHREGEGGDRRGVSPVGECGLPRRGNRLPL